MNFDEMSYEEVKSYAKTLDIRVGNLGKAKLIEKIKEAEKSSSIVALMDDDDEYTAVIEEVEETKEPQSLIESISSAIDDIEGVTEADRMSYEDLPMNEIIPVKSITYGGLVYKSKTTNAVFKWAHLGSLEYMTVAEINEMNNYNEAYLNRPLVILLDERAVRKFRLQRVYEEVAKINNLKQLFTMPSSVIERTIDNALDVNMRDILISKISQMIKNRALVDINIIKLVSYKLSYDFEDLLI